MILNLNDSVKMTLKGNFEDVFGVAFNLHFATDFLEFTEVRNLDVFNDSNAIYENGYVKGGASLTSSQAAPVTGEDLSFMELYFRVIRVPGMDLEFSLSNLHVLDNQGNELNAEANLISLDIDYLNLITCVFERIEAL